MNQIVKPPAAVTLGDIADISSTHAVKQFAQSHFGAYITVTCECGKKFEGWSEHGFHLAYASISHVIGSRQMP